MTKIETEEEEELTDRELRIHTPMAMGILGQIHMATIRMALLEDDRYQEDQLQQQVVTADREYQVELANDDKADMVHPRYQLQVAFQHHAESQLKRMYRK